MGLRVALICLMLSIGCIAEQGSHRFSGKEKIIQVLLDTMQDTRALSQSYNAQACARIALENLIQISDQFDAEYLQCHDTAESATATLDENTLERRNDLVAQVNSACSSLSDCEELENANFFTCYNEKSSSASYSLKDISGVSKVEGSYYEAGLNSIKANLEICQTAAYADYDRRVDNNSRELGVCLELGEWPTTVAPTTPEPTEEPSTPEPTEEPSTPEPTEEPSTPEPTEEPSTPEPTEEPSTPEPTEEPSTPEPTEESSTPEPTEEPITPEPTEEPSTSDPTEEPSTPEPTEEPSTPEPTEEPSTPEPTEEPSTSDPTEEPSTPEPTEEPSTPGSTDEYESYERSPEEDLGRFARKFLKSLHLK